MSWHPDDPRSWSGWHPQDPRWGRHRPILAWGHGRPLYDNQLGHRLPTGGPPAAAQLSMLMAIGLFLLRSLRRWGGWSVRRLRVLPAVRIGSP
jgi:hypothetical protein